ncbi:uncharacterized protein F5147DRAFT_815688 [Suillus discolor]|uniref:Uncharacterized protein n=1 Tax=Suillus discolor TaxID=1912936 RepID=A0A9P7F0Q6_9AGAM|nr:uncharacterized protein F5147DRAFT_815688 [Suillus discolor]KAG2098736.1 hypothetical protein F5147DRAFT_815688 [Suillus discolor]
MALAAINSCVPLNLVQHDLELVLSHRPTTIRKGRYSFYTVNLTVDEQVHVIVPADKNLIALRAASTNKASPPKEWSKESCRSSTAVASADHLASMLDDFQCKNPNCKADWRTLWDVMRTHQTPRYTYGLFQRSIWPMYNMAGVEKGQCKMNRFVATLTNYNGMTAALAQTPQSFTEEKIRSIDNYIKANPKAQIGGNKMIRGFCIGLKKFLRCTATRMPLFDDVDGLDNDTLDYDSLPIIHLMLHLSTYYKDGAISNMLHLSPFEAPLSTTGPINDVVDFLSNGLVQNANPNVLAIIRMNLTQRNQMHDLVENGTFVADKTLLHYRGSREFCTKVAAHK